MITYVAGSKGALASDLREQVLLLLSTPAGTVAWDRDFGVDTSCVDMPLPDAQTMMAAELADKIEKYIPRLTLREVTLEHAGENGELRLKVVVDYAGESV